ncbi:MAG: DUF86 domain-containing protein [Acidobacteria bacterium]|nr:MAG: DUF86 domain-containing protein [Acidobacteriota bacterium]REK09533.1 MAG: DUF86 domain-containing protein [Acidobacteriota bacterium]
MSFQPLDYLRHILDEADYLARASSGLTCDEYLRDETLQRAFVRSLEVMGEASKNLSGEFRLRHAEVDWRAIAGMRDRLIHAYFGVDHELVWDVVETKIPPLAVEIRRLCESIEGQ